MKSADKEYFLFVPVFLLSIALIGCAGLKEQTKGFLGVSTKVLEEGRKDALTDIVAFGLNSAYDQAKEALLLNGAYIYAEDRENGMIAVYVSYEDTTPVGVFIESVDQNNSRIDISSPSVYAKEFISALVFAVFDPAQKAKDVKSGEAIK